MCEGLAYNGSVEREKFRKEPRPILKDDNH
jgi:hypothetical protein